MIKIGDALLFLGVDKSQFDKDIKGTEQHVKDSMKKIQDSLKVAGVAMTAIGVAGLKMVDSARELNSRLGQTALTLGVTTKDMRDLALATTDVTFPLKSVADTFEILARAGVRNTEEMKNSAKAFDALADATGSSAEVVAAQLIPAFKVFGIELPQTTQDMDKFTWLTKNTTIDLSDFASVMSYVAMYGRDLNVTIDDMIGIMAALEARGIGGAEATRLFRTAVSQAKDGAISLNDALGLTQDEIEKYIDKMDDAVGITEDYAKIANEQYGIMDKLKQKWEELTLSMGSFLTPLEPILALMTALGPMMIAVAMGAIPKMIAAFKSLALLLFNPITGIIVGLGMVAFGISQIISQANKEREALGFQIRLREEHAKALRGEANQFYEIAIAARDAGMVLNEEALAAIRVYEERQKALRGEKNELYEVLKAAEALGLTLSMGTQAWMDHYESIQKVIEAQRELSDVTRQNISDIQALMGLYPGAAKGFTEAEWAVVGPGFQVLKDIEIAAQDLLRKSKWEEITAAQEVARIAGWESQWTSTGLGRLAGYQHGGLIPEPTLLYGLRSLRPYAVAGEHGPERVSPMNQTASVLITGNTFNIREEADVDRVAQSLMNKLRLQGGR